MDAAELGARSCEPAPDVARHAQDGPRHAAPSAAAAQGGQATPGGLTPRELEILAFERQWWKYAGAKEQAIKELFDLSPTRYYQAVNAVIDKPEALETDPMLVKRLRRLRSSRQRTRAARRLGIETNLSSP